ncbi:uncharacterized protein LOC121793720 [Salvia splendens]|uniref:uncharacterized protein LOC121793720 n=1 Tax=Salvia splendens TaxID=180675 RepID=UPI001C271963|nr:uncharacterized protein LOC121793720 [Salvia splendens]
MSQEASTGSTTSPSDDSSPQCVLEMFRMVLLPDNNHNIEEEDTADSSFDWSEWDEDDFYTLPCMEDELGRKMIKPKGEKLVPSSDVSDICNDAFKKIVDPIGHKDLYDEYMNIYWEEFKK